jgi:hypothetical protein
MSRFVERPFLLALAIVVALGACKKEAFLLGPQTSLAVGAYHSLLFGDACPGANALYFCTDQPVTAVLDHHCDDPTVADVVLQKDHPQGALATHAYYVVGKKAGATTLVFKGMFADGTVRDARIPISVASADTLTVWPTTCYDASAAPDLVASVGATEGFSVAMTAGKETLAGWLPGAVTGDGVTEQFTDGDSNNFTWQAPASPSTVQLQSPSGATIRGALIAFAPAQVTEIDFSPERPAAFTQPGNVAFQPLIRVDGQAPCHALPIEIHSSTPAICSGPPGETVWLGGPNDGNAAVHAEGNCVLAGAGQGGPVLGAQSFPIFFVQAPPTLADVPDRGLPCTVEGGTACDTSYASVLICRGGTWVFHASCGAAETCDFISDATQGCVAGSSCAQCRGLR